MRVVTWNVNSVGARLPRLTEWLADRRPDVLCLQETKCAAAQFPAEPFEALGYELALNSDGRWNGVAICSRVGLEQVAVGFPGQPGYLAPEEPDGLFAAGTPVVEARAVGASCGGLRVWSLYVPNGRAVDHPHYAYKLQWLAALRTALAAEAASGQRLVVTGDLNVARTDEDVWDIADFAGATHVTAAERDAVTALVDLGLTDVLPRPGKGDRPFTYWDYRAGMFHKNLGMRIDYVLADAGLPVTDAYVDREARKGSGPSDHAPVVVDFDLG